MKLLITYACIFLSLATFACPVFANNVAPDDKILIAISPEDPIVYNTKSNKYHTPSCIWAIRSTRNGINIKRSEARARGGRPCKVCNAGIYSSPLQRKYSIPSSKRYTHSKVSRNPVNRLERTKRKTTPKRANYQSHEMKAYIEYVRSRIQESWSTYDTANITATVSLAITKNGKIESIRVLSTTGPPGSIEKVKEAIRYSTPFGSPPNSQAKVMIRFKDASLITKMSDIKIAPPIVKRRNSDTSPPIAPPINNHY